MSALPTLRGTALVSVSLLFFSAGILHFLKTAAFVQIVPNFLPFREAAVYISGVAEIAGALGLLIRLLRRFAAWGLVALLVAVFPANLYMATNNIQLAGTHIPPWLLWARLPVQALLIWTVIWVRKLPDESK